MIQVRELTKRYGMTTAVDNLSFTVEPGRVTGFLGPNGAGKSTAMRLIIGLDRPDCGSALVNGMPYAQLAQPLRHVGALLDARSFHPGRSAFNHLRWLAQSHGIGRKRVDEVLELSGLSEAAHKSPGTFSLGMAQRLGLATAMLGDPPVLLLDEPMNGLDVDGMSWMRQLLPELAAQDRAVLVSSHLMSEMAQLADHRIVIGRGRVVADTSVARFIAQAGGARVRVRSADPERLAKLLDDRADTVQRPVDDDALIVTGLGLNDVALAHAGHRRLAHLHRLGDGVVGPSRSVRALIGLEQNAGVGQRTGRGDAGANQLLQLMSFGFSQGYTVLFDSHLVRLPRHTPSLSNDAARSTRRPNLLLVHSQALC